MTISPFFSVVIPVYNKEPHISRSINSVLSQTYDNYELIIIDDASTDASLEEIYKFSDDRIRVLHRVHPGPGGYAARNLGVNDARADWVVFLDADDEWYPEHLEMVRAAINSNPDNGMISAGWVSVDGNNQELQPYYTYSKEKGTHQINLNNYLDISLAKMRFCQTSVVAVQRTIFNKIGGFPEGRANKGGDLYTWIMVMAHSSGVWSQHIGARVYRDSVNMVTKTADFNPDLIIQMVDELKHKISDNDLYLLKRYANHLLLKDYVIRILRTGRKGFSLNDYIFTVGLFEKFKLLGISILPAGVFKWIKIIKDMLKS